MKRLQIKSSIIKNTVMTRRMQRVYANFNPDEWESVDPFDPMVYQYVVLSSFYNDYIYIKYDDGRYRYIQPISFGASKDGNYHIFCYKDDGQKRRYSLNRIQNFLFHKDFISDYFNYEQEDEEVVQDIVQDIVQDTPVNQVEENLDNQQTQNEELPFDKQIQFIEQVAMVRLKKRKQKNKIDQHNVFLDMR